MTRNTGKPSEEQFEDRWATLGKRAWTYRFPDAAEIRGRTGKIGATRPVPSDFLVVHDGQTEFAEVKSTQDPTAFRFSLLRKVQSAAATMVVSAGGSYWVYVHRILTDEWFRFPYSLTTKIRATGKASIPWNDLKEHAWNSPT